VTLLYLGAGATALQAQEPVPYRDLSYRSAVFGREKFYRLYLPRGYQDSGRRYPVVYFFHGWGGRHFKDDNAKLAYEKLGALVDAYHVIMVMWDGNFDEKEPRPYNVGDHADVKFQIQMSDCFRELVSYIDGEYRTLADRSNRGIIGFSMGGFVSFFLAGKFPDMVSSAVSMAGSPEFFVGHPENHTLYPVRYAFRNLQGVHIRMQSGDSDILFFLNTEVHEGAQWEGIPLDYWQFHGGHMVDRPGETKAFESALKFTVNGFHGDNTPPQNWTHYDLYPEFDVWGYHVESTKHEPGFVVLGDVDGTGFSVGSRRWLPDGPPVRGVRASVKTPPIYLSGGTYHVVRLNGTHQAPADRLITCGADGSLSVDSIDAGTHIGIFRTDDAPAFVCLGYSVGSGGRFLSVRGDNTLRVRLFNRGGEAPLPCTLRATVTSGDTAVIVHGGELLCDAHPAERVLALPPVVVSCAKRPPVHAGPALVKFTVTVHAGNAVHRSTFDVPVNFDVPLFGTLRFDDGAAVRERAQGSGNADGVPDAGERVAVYEGDHRLRLYTDDPWIINDDERAADEIIPAIWPDGYTLSSVIRISPDCPDGHPVECLASYETKSYNPIERSVTWGKVRFTVRRR